MLSPAIVGKRPNSSVKRDPGSREGSAASCHADRVGLSCDALVASEGAVRPMKTEDRRVCPSCGNEFSGAVEFCPVCMLRKAVADGVESGESLLPNTNSLVNTTRVRNGLSIMN